MRSAAIGLLAVILAACGSSGGGDGPANCVEAVSQGISQACCIGHGIDACGAGLFCAAFDGRTQATCYPERSRPDLESCSEDRHCASGSCNSDEGLCRSTPWTSCNPAVGCVADPAGSRHACVEETGTCQLVGDGSYGSACETDADCRPRLTCDGGLCTMTTPVCGRPSGEGPCLEDPNSDDCHLCRLQVGRCPNDCDAEATALYRCNWETECIGIVGEEGARCTATLCDAELCAYESCVVAGDCRDVVRSCY